MSIFKTGNTFYNTHILLVDDDPDLLFVFDFFLKSEGYGNVKTCTDSKIALKYAMENIKSINLLSWILECQISMEYAMSDSKNIKSIYKNNISDLS